MSHKHGNVMKFLTGIYRKLYIYMYIYKYKHWLINIGSVDRRQNFTSPGISPQEKPHRSTRYHNTGTCKSVSLMLRNVSTLYKR